MTELKIIIDGVTHEYVKADISAYACKTCSLIKYCSVSCTTFCMMFDNTGNGRPTGKYGHFQAINTLVADALLTELAKTE